MMWGCIMDLSKPWVKEALEFVLPSFVSGLNKSVLTPFSEYIKSLFMLTQLLLVFGKLLTFPSLRFSCLREMPPALWEQHPPPSETSSVKK